MVETQRIPVLVTGGAGYIGSHAVLALLDEGWPVTVIDDLSSGHRWAVPDGAEFVHGDIGDQKLIGKLLATRDIRAVMHFAGSIIVPESVEKPLKYYGNNTAKTRALLEACVEAGLSHFLFSSTAATYGIPDQVPIREDQPTRPINPYGWSKLMSEQMLADTAAAHPMNFCALRYFNVAGADPGGRSGQSTAGATHLIKVAAEVVTGQRDEIAVYGTDYDTPDGTGIRDYIHVSDLASAHLRALEMLIDRPDQNHILNCGYGRGYSVLEVLDAVDRVTGGRIKRKMAPRRAGDPPILVADNSKILATLGWRPERDDIETIVREALSWETTLRSRPLS